MKLIKRAGYLDRLLNLRGTPDVKIITGVRRVGELLRRGYEAYVGKVGDLEVDFIAMRGSEKMYVQVSIDISDKETFRREITPFAKIRDAYPRLLLARTHQPEYDYEGLRIVNLADWLA